MHATGPIMILNELYNEKLCTDVSVRSSPLPSLDTGRRTSHIKA